MSAIKYWVEKHRDKINVRFSIDFILDAVQLILENNSFNFNDKNYLQIRGTALGTKFAPTYATLVMGFLEQNLYQKIEKTLGIEMAKYIENSWYRFLDDCFIIWTKTDQNLKTFSGILNDLHPAINFTSEKNN